VKQVIQASGVMPYEPYGFTGCVRFGDILYLSGISAMDLQGRVMGDDIETQTVHTYRNIERVLQAGGSSLDRILQMTSFVVDLAKNGARYVATRKTNLTRPTYTSATIGIAALMVPGLVLEVQCTAAAA
jgi:enamine deaminase RidA (YjgF/YER057c/UK114 family)